MPDERMIALYVNTPIITPQTTWLFEAEVLVVAWRGYIDDLRDTAIICDN